jgi:SAM-dependent methyltransferase
VTPLFTPLHHRRDDCRLCGSQELVRVLALEPTPPANAFVAESRLDEPQPTFPLDVFLCETCGHVQLLDVVDPRLLFENYVYVSGTSPVFVNHFRHYVSAVREHVRPAPGALVVDVGSNDGTLLKLFKEAGHSVLGVDPAHEIARHATESGIETLPEFFTPALAERIVSRHGRAKIVTANNVFAHADDLHSIVDGIRTLLEPDGMFVFEVSYLRDVYEKTLFDTIYHEHLSYHSVGPLVGFFARHGMTLVDVERVASHGGSIRGMVRLAEYTETPGHSVSIAVAEETELGVADAETFRSFGKRIDELRDELAGLLRRLQSEGKTVAGYGAPAKATTLMYHFGLDGSVINFIVDDSPLKQNLFSPGLHIPVVPSSALDLNRPDYLLVLAWNFADSIIRNNRRYAESGGTFIIPIPELRIVSGDETLH